MTEPPAEFDDLGTILAASATAPLPALRDAILMRTERVLRRRRIVNRLTKLGTVAAVFALGIGLGREQRTQPEPILQKNLYVTSTVFIPVVILVPIPAEEPSTPQPIARTDPTTAAQAELLAEQADDRGEAARLYRLAGDTYLNDVQDYRNAARCYRLHLARAGDPALQPDAKDTWLLTSLKNAAFKEKFDVAKTDG